MRKRNLIVIPQNMRKEIFDTAHGTPISGHQGVEKTASRIKTNYWWYGIYADIIKWIDACEICQRAMKPGKPNFALQPLNQEIEANSRVHVDIVTKSVFP